MGLTHPGAEAALLPNDIVTRTGELPPAVAATTGRPGAAAGRARSAARLQNLIVSTNSPATITAALQLLAGVGRRTAELCALSFDCWTSMCTSATTVNTRPPRSSCTTCPGRQDSLPITDPRPGSGDHPRPAGPDQGRIPRHTHRSSGAARVRLLRVTDLAHGGVVAGEAGLGVRWPRSGGSGGAGVVGVSRRWSGCRGLGVVVGFGDRGSGAGFVDEVLAGGAGGDERGEGEAVDGAGFAAAGFVDERDRRRR